MKLRGKKSRGNMLLILILLIVVSFSLVALLKLSVSSMNDTRQKAEDIGQANTFIAVANICADTFLSDLEGLSWLMTVADINNLYGVSHADYGIEIYDKAIGMFQEAMQLQDLGEGRWQYHLTDPWLAFEYAGLADRDTRKYLDNQLKDAKIVLTVLAPLSVYSEEGDKTDLQDEDSISITDIIFTVKLTKGTWRLTQTYRLSGVKLLGSFGEAQVRFAIDGDEAVCHLEGQTITRMDLTK